nr:copper chaperone PCu(A)C [Pseudoclavibacter sp. Marseille-Q3772]
MNVLNRTLATAAAGMLALAALTGCSASGTPSASESAATGASQDAAQHGLVFHDMWVKATDSGMTGVFGTIENTGDQEVTLAGVEFAHAGMAEFHETIVQSDGSSMMQKKPEMPTIKPGESWTLEPGHDHIMLMKLDEPIEPSHPYTMTLNLADGSECEVEISAREYTGGQETYAPDDEHGGHEHGDHSGHDHGDHSGHDHGETEHSGH